MREKHYLLFVLMVVAVLAISPQLIQSQITTGHLSGVITDTSGNPIEAASLTVQQANTINFFQAFSDEKGRYSFPNLAPGVYTITAEAEGFLKTIQAEVTIRLGAKARLNFSLMQSMELTEEVIVTAEAPVVETTKTALDQNISLDQFKDIPAQGRDFNSIINTFSGVTSWNSNFNSMGSRDNQNNFLIDGMKNNELGDTQTPFFSGYRRSLYGYFDPTKEAGEYVLSNPGSSLGQFNFDAIEEVQVSTAAYSVEHGQGSGAVFNMVTRSGTDKFKFGFTVNHQTDKINAQVDNPYPMKRWQESVFIGGPLIKGKLRLFITYDRDDYNVGFDDRVINAANLNLWVADLDLWQSQQSVNRITGKLTYISSESNKYNLTMNFFGDGSSFLNTQWRPEGNYEDRMGTNRGLSLLLNNQRQFKNGLLQMSAKYSFVDRFVESSLGGDNLELRPATAGFPFWIRRVGTQGPEVDINIKSFQFKSTYNWFIKDWGGDHNLLFGVDYESYGQKTDQKAWSYVAFWNMDGPTSFPYEADTWYLWFASTMPGHSYTLPLSQAAAYINEEWLATDRITVSAGIRLDWDEFIDKLYFTPRLGLAWDPIGDGKTVVRGGFGVFRDRADLMSMAKSMQERGTLTYFNSAGPFTSDPSDLATWKKYLDRGGGSFDAGGDIFERDPNLQPPVTYEANIGFERDLFKGFAFRANYIFKNMDKLFYEQRFNAFTQMKEGFWARPDPTKPTIFRLTNIGNMKAHDIELILTKNFSSGSFLNLSYVYETTKGNSSRALAFWFESYFNQTGDDPEFFELKAPADFEIRHYFKGSWSFTLPFDILFSGFAQIRSGRPFTVYMTGNYPWGWRLPEGYNSRRMPGFETVDIRISKRFRIGQARFQAYVDMFNLLNKDNVIAVQGSQRAVNYLQPLGFGSPRQAQIGFRFEWN